MTRTPTRCPSCERVLQVTQLDCAHCGTSVRGDFVLPEFLRLSMDDQAFILSFVRHSGSLKEMAKLYEVSYPTVRNRLDDLIAKLPDNTELKESADESTDPR